MDRTLLISADCHGGPRVEESRGYRHQVGVDRIMWGTDYPHMEGWWPHTAEKLAAVFKDVPRDEVEPMLGGTAARVYGFDLDRLLPLAAELGPRQGSIGL